MDAQAATQSGTTRAQAHSDRCRTRIEECLRTTPHGAERLDRRNEVINEALAGRNEVIDEALAEEATREEQRKKRSDRAAAEVPEVSEPREDPIESNPNPKRRLLMKSASLTASGSGQQRGGKAIPDDESGMQFEDSPEIDRGIVDKHQTENCNEVGAEAVTTQEAVDGYREKAMRIESVEQIELGSMEFSLTGQVLRWARQSNLCGGVSLRKADGWNLKNHSHLTVATHLREKIHSSVLVVTIRGEERRRMC